MDSRNPGGPSLKQKAMHAFQDYVVISLYLAFFLCVLATYTMLLLRGYKDSPISYAYALFNAFVIGKVILIGEVAHFGKELEHRPLYQSAIYKAFMFCLLALALYFVEEFVKRMIHGEAFGGSLLREIRIEDLICRSVVIFSVFIPLFAFRELKRVLGEDKFHTLFFRSAVADNHAQEASEDAHTSAAG